MKQLGGSASVFVRLVSWFGPPLLALLLLVGIEGGLRMAGLGEIDTSRTSQLAYQQLRLPILRHAIRPDRTKILETWDERLPYQAVLEEKPEDGLRIFVVGGSAAAGLGFSPNVTFARQLERLLRAGYPDRTIEIVNLGIVALSSKQVRVLASEIAESYEGDLLVVYSGNNEFLELHAQKYAASRGGWRYSLRQALMETNLFRLLADAFSRHEEASPRESDLSHESLRLTQDIITREIDTSPEEVEQTLDAYEDNLREVSAVARRGGIQVLLMTVASNWRWQGREDLPEDWIEKLLGIPGPATGERLRKGRDIASQQIETASGHDLAEWLYKRALFSEALGDLELARSDYRRQMNVDPHLRRALDKMADRVRRVAREDDLLLVDTIELLEREAEHGIVGFGQFYDYVHFTPGAVFHVAAELHDKLQDVGLISGDSELDPAQWITTELAALEALGEDAFDVERWMGYCFDASMIDDRDLWKYDRTVEELDGRLAEDPTDARAWVYRGNASFFRIDGAARAAESYTRALDLLGSDPEIEKNLERLRRERLGIVPLP